MIIRIENAPRDYAWGSLTQIANFQNRTPSGSPEAEVWLGTHPGSPTQIVNPELAEGASTVAEYLSRTNKPQLSFLLKLLAADHPLSIQVHPNKTQARAGFEKENAQGISLEDPQRNYKDDSDKPELIVALSETFDALCGLRPHQEVIEEFTSLAHILDEAGHTSAALAEFVVEFSARSESAYEWALSWALGDSGAKALVGEISAAAKLTNDALLRELSEDYPCDPGIIVALLLNRVSLKAGEALYLPAGNLHAYLRGFGIELMAPSDNVIRGGLTPKHVDVPELLEVASTKVVEIPYLNPVQAQPGIQLFHPAGSELNLARVSPAGNESHLELGGTAIAVCCGDEVTISQGSESLTLTQGQSVLITDEEKRLTISGSGHVFIAF